jgi:predicted nucleic-acid-binding protein
MAFKLFIDANVYLDVLLCRGNEWEEADSIFNLAVNRQVELFTSASNLLNLMYIMHVNKISRHEIVNHTFNILNISKLVNPENQVFITALTSTFTDLEDAVQYFTALQIKGMDYFVTCNIKDFKKALPQLPVITPKQLLKIYNGE